MRAESPPLVSLSNVEKHYGDFHALKNVNLDIAEREVVVVIGPSGSGKSTLCRTINRLETITSGSITIDGRELPAEGAALAQLRSDVGMVFQSFNLFAHKTILENVTLGPIKVRKTPKAEADKQAMALLERVGVAHQADKYPAQLSGGQQQRVAIARSLAMKPKVMLFDEPTSALEDSALEDSALGFIVTYQDLLYQVNLIGREYNNLLPTFIVGAALFIIINMIVAGFARWLESRLQRKTTADTEAEGLTSKLVD